MIILKFGGSSVANAENIQKVKNILLSNGLQSRLVVFSAFTGVTDSLINIGSLAETGDDTYTSTLKALEKRHLDTAKALLPVETRSSCLSFIMQRFNELEDICESVFTLRELSPSTKDRIISFGEILSSTIISAYLSSLQIANTWLDSRRLITTDSSYGNAKVDFDTTNENIQQAVHDASAALFIAPGFVASDKKGHTTTLGRGGSDYSAAIYAAALQAEHLEIWTDVSGMMTADPRWVLNAKPIPKISYREAMELSHFGAKVIYPPTILPVMEKNIPVWIKNTFAPHDEGTLIHSEHDTDRNKITGISSMTGISLLSIEGGGMVGIPGFSKTLFEALASAQVSVILITQSSSEYSICVAVRAEQAEIARNVVNRAFRHEILSKIIEPVKVENELAVIAIVGEKMQSHPGISGKMFGALGRNGVNIRAIAQGSSEKNISAVIAAKDTKKAVNVMHEAFFETAFKQLNVFLFGTGNVGKKLLGQIQQQYQYLEKNLHLQVRIVGITNSRKMYIQETGGINLTHWDTILDQQGEKASIAAFTQNIIDKNLRNSVVVDVTANEAVALNYHHFLAKSISIVACNKIACAAPYSYYRQLKQLAQDFNARFYFETNVGAGLPVIGTLSDLINSGDRITKIQAVLSGTLNFVFNNYDGSRPFAEVVRQAQDEGYTEPDPRLDLGGTDVMRKIMILAREAGNVLEMEDIQNTSFLPAECYEGDVAQFYKSLLKYEAHFKALYDAAAAENCKLKFVAEYKDGKASVGLQHIPSDSDFYHLYGKDNIVIFYTDRYADQPLVVKGAGAGADVTASGVFADLIKAGN